MFRDRIPNNNSLQLQEIAPFSLVGTGTSTLAIPVSTKHDIHTKKSTPKRPSKPKFGRWHKKFVELAKYNVEHGHCNVSRDSDDKSTLHLARWAVEQRMDYRKRTKNNSGPMTQERIDLLEAIDFVWDIRGESWNKYFNNLKSFKEKYGHSCPKASQNESLCGWVKRQYRLSKVVRPSPKVQERIDKLNSIGFVWKQTIEQNAAPVLLPTPVQTLGRNRGLSLPQTSFASTSPIDLTSDEL